MVCGLVLRGFKECLSDDFYCDEAEYQASSSERGDEWVAGEVSERQVVFYVALFDSG